MRWSLKFSTKGKRDGGGPGAGKSYQGTDSIRNGVGTVGGTGHQSSNAERGDPNEDHERGGTGIGDSDSRTPIVTPPDANGGERAEAVENKVEAAQAQTERHQSAPPFTVDSAGREGAGEDVVEGEAGGQHSLAEMDEGLGRTGGDNQDDVFDDDSQEDADSLQASKTARIRSFADDPDAHVLEDSGAEWDGEKEESGREDGGAQRESADGDRSPAGLSRGEDGGGSHSYHSETEAADDASSASHGDPSRGRTSTDGAKSGTYNSFGGMSSANPAVSAEGAEDSEQQKARRLEEDDGDAREDVVENYRVGVGEDYGRVGPRGEAELNHRHQDRVYPTEAEQEVDDGLGYNDDDEGDDDGRHNDVDNSGRRGGGSSGYVIGRARKYPDPERRAHAHALVDDFDPSNNSVNEIDVSREGQMYGGGVGVAYGGSTEMHMQHQQQHQQQLIQQRHHAVAAAGGVNGISPVDARTAAALAARTRLAAGGVAVPDRGAGMQRSEPGPVATAGQAVVAGQAAAAAAAALRRGPTPGSHSLPSMVLVPLEALKANRKLPRSSDRRALVRYRDLPDRSRSFVVFVSHAWMRPHTTPSFAHPDTSSRGGEKYRLIAEAGDRIRAHLPPDVRVLLWIDYACVDQDSTRRSKATMRGMREYMRRCDAILTVYPGEAADNGEEFLPNRFVKSCAWAGSYKSLAHYCTRGWCRLEMLLGQTEPLPQDGFMFNFLVPKKKKVSGAKASVGDRPHFLYGAHQRPHNGRIDVVPRQSSRWFEEHHPEQGNFTHESDRDAIRAVLAKQTSTMAKKTAAIAARYGTDPRRGISSGGGRTSDRQHQHQYAGEPADYGRLKGP